MVETHVSICCPTSSDNRSDWKSAHPPTSRGHIRRQLHVYVMSGWVLLPPSSSRSKGRHALVLMTDGKAGAETGHGSYVMTSLHPQASSHMQVHVVSKTFGPDEPGLPFSSRTEEQASVFIHSFDWTAYDKILRSLLMQDIQQNN